MTFPEFERLVKDALNEIPPKFTSVLEKNQIRVLAREKVPSPVKKRYKGSTVYGMFIGVPLGRFFDMAAEPTRIELYQESFEASFDKKSEIKRQVLITVVHEIAHYFGFSEEDMGRL
jgi:predicted Zn-dependent protease with MMP-like domain